MSSDCFELRDRCPACNSINFKQIHKSAYKQPPIINYLNEFYGPLEEVDLNCLNDATYSLCLCNDCDLIFQKEIPNDFLMDRFYGHWVDPHKALIKHKNNTLATYYNHSYELTHCISYFNQNPANLKFLDFGMGWGDWALMAKAFGCQSYGLELSLERIHHAESNGIEILDMKSITQHQFDFINAEQVFEHLANPYETLCELKKALKPNGIIKISVPKTRRINKNPEKVDWNNYSVSLNSIAPMAHINTFRNSSLINMAERANMKELFLPINKPYRSYKSIKNKIKEAFKPERRKYLNSNNYSFFQNIV